MPINAQCVSCTARYKVVDSAAGRRVKCRRCGNSMDLPGDAAMPDPFAVLAQLEKNAPAAAAAPDAALFQYRAVMSTVAAPTASGPTTKHGTSIKDLQPDGGKAASRKEKRGAPSVGLPGGPLIPLIAAGAILMLLALSLVSPVFALLAMGVAVLITLAGGIWGIITAFRESVVCGLLYFFFGIYALYYVSTRWDEMKYPVLTQLAGLGMFYLAARLGGTHLPFGQ
ncbi:MAG: hypothetical protein JWM97_1917 [Phycisphaerales bacterium]|nr:hypothetical protein [Phycisphaerales bacterium]